MLYEKLNEEMRRTVDEFAERLRPLSWQRRSDLLGEAALSFTDRFEGDEARLASTGFMTAVLERLGSEEVNNPFQASLFLLSLNPEHRALAEDYLALNPEVRQVVEAELGHGGDGTGEKRDDDEPPN